MMLSVNLGIRCVRLQSSENRDCRLNFVFCARMTPMLVALLCGPQLRSVLHVKVAFVWNTFRRILMVFRGKHRVLAVGAEKN